MTTDEREILMDERAVTTHERAVTTDERETKTDERGRGIFRGRKIPRKPFRGGPGDRIILSVG